MRRFSPDNRGFTLIELVVAMSISSVVVVFVAMFMAAPMGAYETQSRRAALTADAASAWPAMETELRAALPNSLRARRNGSFVALEMLKVVDWTRYMAPPSASFTAAGVFRGIGLPFNSNGYYLSVNNLGVVGADAYTLTGSMTPALTGIQISATGVPGESLLAVNPAPVFVADSPQHRIYLVEGPVTFLCDEGAGTLRRYENYPIVANQAARDAPNDFAALGLAGTLIAQGLTRCEMNVSAFSATVPQTAAVILTVTRNGDTVTLLHTARAEYLP